MINGEERERKNLSIIHNVFMAVLMCHFAVMTFTHRTPFGAFIPLISPSNYSGVATMSEIPRVIVHLEGR